ncbi:MAG: hypothetical protein ACT443_04110 [Gemmatimonadota bacterium]
MRNVVHAALLLVLLPLAADAQVRVNPTGVNVNSQGASTVFLTFGGVVNLEPVEAVWCGRLVPAAPDRGNKCDAATIFGRLPARYNLSRSNGAVFTDIMSIPATVTRRAYEAALQGENSSFFYVRRFRNTAGGPDEYVAVTCRMAGGGARVPFALTYVDVRFDAEAPLLFLTAGTTPPPLRAEIQYNGTGTLRGRWEIVLPGEQLPAESDLLTEATLPPNERGLQKRYTQLERFNVFLPPTGRVTLPGPDPARLPVAIDGQYMVLLRIEASDDKEGDSSLAGAGAGQGIVHTGAVAGFPMPMLRYVIGSAASAEVERPTRLQLGLVAPAAEASARADSALAMRWQAVQGAGFYRLELEKIAGTTPLFAAVIDPGHTTYEVPPFAIANVQEPLRWRVLALDAQGRELRRSEWRTLQIR